MCSTVQSGSEGGLDLYCALLAFYAGNQVRVRILASRDVAELSY